MTEEEKKTRVRVICLARTVLFNYGQSLWTPHSIYLNLCHLTETEPRLSALPSFKPIPFAFSFFSKEFAIPWNIQGCKHFMLYNKLKSWEEADFLSQSSGVKISWLRNFGWMQELFFNFSEEEIKECFKILREWKRPSYTSLHIPFQLKKTA